MRHLHHANIFRHVLIWAMMVVAQTWQLCGAADARFPPSRYVGIYDFYLGCENGQLPETTPQYTGVWTWSENGKVLLEGHYTDGIPSGEWREFSETGITRRECVYAQNNAFKEIVYYPDGTPRLEITGVCFYKPSRVRRQIDSIRRVDEKSQIGPFPKNRMAPCTSFIRSRHDEYSENYLTLRSQAFQFSTFQHDLNTSQWRRDVLDGFLNWKDSAIHYSNDSQQFPHSLTLYGDTPFLFVTLKDEDKYDFIIVDDPYLTNKVDVIKNQVLYVSEFLSLADIEFSSETTGVKTKASLYVRMSGFYLPGAGWSDVIVEPAGVMSYPITEPSVFPNIDETIPAGAKLYFDYQSYGRQWQPKDLTTYGAIITYMIYLGTGRLWLHKIGHGTKDIDFKKYHELEQNTQQEDSPAVVPPRADRIMAKDNANETTATNDSDLPEKLATSTKNCSIVCGSFLKPHVIERTETVIDDVLVKGRNDMFSCKGSPLDATAVTTIPASVKLALPNLGARIGVPKLKLPVKMNSGKTTVSAKLRLENPITCERLFDEHTRLGRIMYRHEFRVIVTSRVAFYTCGVTDHNIVSASLSGTDFLDLNTRIPCQYKDGGVGE